MNDIHIYKNFNNTIIINKLLTDIDEWIIENKSKIRSALKALDRYGIILMTKVVSLFFSDISSNWGLSLNARKYYTRFISMENIPGFLFL